MYLLCIRIALVSQNYWFCLTSSLYKPDTSLKRKKLKDGQLESVPTVFVLERVHCMSLKLDESKTNKSLDEFTANVLENKSWVDFQVGKRNLLKCNCAIAAKGQFKQLKSGMLITNQIKEICFILFNTKRKARKIFYFRNFLSTCIKRLFSSIIIEGRAELAFVIHMSRRGDYSEHEAWPEWRYKGMKCAFHLVSSTQPFSFLFLKWVIFFFNKTHLNV